MVRFVNIFTVDRAEGGESDEQLFLLSEHLCRHWITEDECDIESDE